VINKEKNSLKALNKTAKQGKTFPPVKEQFIYADTPEVPKFCELLYNVELRFSLLKLIY